MQAYVIHKWGDFDQLRLETVAEPKPRPNEVVIRVKAIGLNPLDYIVLSGALKEALTLPIIVGSDVAGTVASIGTDVTSLQVGDAVMGLINFPGSDGTFAGHGYAQSVAVPADQVITKPSGLSFETAAALPAVGLTAWQALSEVASLPAGSRILIHGAAGGVGHMAVQIAKLHGMHVTATAGAKHQDFVIALGAEKVIDYNQQRFETVVTGVDCVFDTVGGNTMRRSLSALKRGGILVTTQWPELASIQDDAAAKGIIAKAVYVKPNAGHLRTLARLVAEEQLRVNVETYPFAKLPQALARLKAGGVQGKLVVKVGDN